MLSPLRRAGGVFHFSLLTFHSTPLALSHPSQGSWRGPGARGEAFLLQSTSVGSVNHCLRSIEIHFHATVLSLTSSSAVVSYWVAFAKTLNRLDLRARHTLAQQIRAHCVCTLKRRLHAQEKAAGSWQHSAQLCCSSSQHCQYNPE